MPEKTRWGFMDREGNKVIVPQFRQVGRFSEGLAAVQECGRGMRWGYVDKAGKMVIQPRFVNADVFSEGLAPVVLDGDAQAFIDRTGKVVLKVKDEPAVGLRYGYRVIYSDRWELDRDDTTACPGPFRGGLAPVQGWPEYRFVDRSGRTAFKNRFAWAGPFSEGLALVRHIGGGCGHIDRSGRALTRQRFDRAESFSEGLAYVATGSRAGYIDKSGSMVLAMVPKRTGGRGDPSFHEGLAAREVPAGDDIRFGYIDRSGRVVIRPWFSRADGFSEGLAHVTSYQGVEGLIDRTGRFVYCLRERESAMTGLSEGLAGVAVTVPATESDIRLGLVDDGPRSIHVYIDTPPEKPHHSRGARSAHRSVRRDGQRPVHGSGR